MKKQPIKPVDTHCDCKIPELVGSISQQMGTNKMFQFCKECNRNRWIKIKYENEEMRIV